MQRITVKAFPPTGLARERRGKTFIGISLKGPLVGAPLRREVLDWTQSNVGTPDLFVGDYLNRHNYQAFDRVPEAQAIEQAMRDGARTIDHLKGLLSAWGVVDVAITSASCLYKDPSFSSRLARFNKQYSENESFKTLIDRAVDAYLTRKRHDKKPDENVSRHCVAYQLEELVLFELLAEANYRTLVYAGPQLPVMKSIVSGQLKGASDALEALTLIELRTHGDRSV